MRHGLRSAILPYVASAETINGSGGECRRPLRPLSRWRDRPCLGIDLRSASSTTNPCVPLNVRNEQIGGPVWLITGNAPIRKHGTLGETRAAYAVRLERRPSSRRLSRMILERRRAGIAGRQVGYRCTAVRLPTPEYWTPVFVRQATMNPAGVSGESIVHQPPSKSSSVECARDTSPLIPRIIIGPRCEPSPA